MMHIVNVSSATNEGVAGDIELMKILEHIYFLLEGALVKGSTLPSRW